MKKNLKSAILLCVLFVSQYLIASPMLLMRLRPDESYKSHDRIARKLSKPGKLGGLLQEGTWKTGSVAGIFATYAGYLTVSPPDGLLYFPLEQSKPLFHLVVTRKIVPVVGFANTVDHMALDPAQETGFYLVEQKRDDMTGKLFWRVSKEDLPENNKLPFDAVILFAKPKNVMVTLGETPAKPGQHFVLPDIFIRKGINIVGRSLYVVNIAQFFKPVRLHAKVEPKRLIEQAV